MRFTPNISRLHIGKARKKSTAGQKVLDKLNDFLDSASDEAVEILVGFWSDQQQAITYKELIDAINNGYLDYATIQAWQNDYANFVTEKLLPIWIKSMEAANAERMKQHSDFIYDPMGVGTRDWIYQHGGQWISTMSDAQKEAISALLQQSATGIYTVDELSRVIRPLIGLNKPQAMANLNYYNHVKESLLQFNPNMKVSDAKKAAQDAALKYAARQHRQRAYTIATTEMAFAYNKGADDGIRQAQEQGFMGKVKKVWSTAGDERVCLICGALDGKEVDMDDDFDFKGSSLYDGQKKVPPAHPRCRCALLYEEV